MEKIKVRNLSAESQATILDFENLGWAIERNEFGWQAEKIFFGKEEFRCFFEKVESLKALEQMLKAEEEIHAQAANELIYQTSVDTMPTISINTEFKCSKCEKPGVVEENPDGLCLDCISKLLIENYEGKRPRFTLENCKVILTEEDIDICTDKLLKSLNQIDAEKLNFESVRKNYQSKMKDYEKAVNRFRRSIDSGYEWRDVECIEIFKYAKGQVEIYRTDTNEHVRTRNMTDKEKQSKLFTED